MFTSCYKKVKQFKSPLLVVAAFLLRSRETQAKRADEKSQQIKQLKKVVEQQQKSLDELQEQLHAKQAEAVQLKIENQRLRDQPPIYREEPKLPRHEFGPKMISLSINLARRVGIRASADVLELVFDWFEVSTKLPKYSTIRTWMLRAGVAAIERPIEAADDWIWMVDHSNQIGQEKVLVVLGLRASNMPPPGAALKHEDVRVLALVPGVHCKTEDVAAVYDQLAQRCGVPLAVLADGAVELRDAAEVLQKHGVNQKTWLPTIVLGDFKHHAANLLKKMLESDTRFAKFGARLGRTRSSTQQTELAHLTPPGGRPKARFMNLASTLHWAEMVSWQLSHPHSEARREISARRMNQKLGWLRGFRNDIARWSACQKVMSASITWINEQGVFPGATQALRAHLQRVLGGEQDQEMTDKLLQFVHQEESKLIAGQRLPLSTEILESSFGLFKQLEGQHSKGGFTSLLAAYGCQLQTATPESIRRDFALISVKAQREWVRDNLGTTLTSKRQTAYQEYRHAA